MKKTLTLLATILLAGQAFATPADDLLDRIGGAGTSGRIITALTPGDGQTDIFTISAENGKPKISGNSYVVVAAGIHWYLKYYAGVTLTWNQLSADLSRVNFPLPATAETRTTTALYRYYLNYCTYSYSMAFWDWTRWEKEIDWMALHGVNMPLALTGADVVWRNVLTKKLGYTKAEANAFIAGSGFQAWFLMNNLEGWGGPEPDAWYEQREQLQKMIVARMTELGMYPVLPGYSGMVPHNIGAKKGWQIADPGSWCGFQRPGFLLPTDAHFNEMAKYYYDELRALYGSSRYYAIDPFHEGGNTAGVDLKAAFKAVYNAMKNYSGSSITPKWVIQSWQENPRQEALDALEPGTLIVLDLFSDGVKKWGNSYRQTDGDPHEFVYCMLHNFGGRIGLHGRLAHTISGYYAARAQYPQTMRGVGATPEGIETNPMLYEALYELPWREAQSAAEDWLKQYACARYGLNAANANIDAAWTRLLRSVYSCTTQQQGTTESLLCARPSMTANKVSTWSTSAIYWNVDDVRNAAAYLLAANDKITAEAARRNYEYDLVDVVRQCLADLANATLKDIAAAHSAGNIAQRNAAMDKFLDILLSQDTLLNTMPDFMLGTWLAAARSLGSTEADKDLYERNARLQITTWGPEGSANSGGLHDYSNREWAGLLRDFYYPRWKWYFDEVKAKNTASPISPKQFFDMEYAWATTPTQGAAYATEPQSDAATTARRIFSKFFAAYLQPEIAAPRKLGVRVDDAARGSALIDDAEADEVENSSAITVRATANSNFFFHCWTADNGDTVSFRTPYVYCGSADIVLTAHFAAAEGGSSETSYTLPAGQQSQAFQPPLSSREQWTLSAETTQGSATFNEWGSAVFTNLTDPFTISGGGFQYYLQADGDLVLNNSATPLCKLSTLPAVMRFSVASDGTGTLKVLANAGGGSYEQSFSLADISLISKATQYSMTLRLTRAQASAGETPNMISLAAIAPARIVEPQAGSCRAPHDGAFAFSFEVPEKYNAKVLVNGISAAEYVYPQGASGAAEFSHALAGIASDMRIEVVPVQQVAEPEPPAPPTAVPTASSADDPVVETRYFNLQGQLVQQPTQTGIYILRQKHRSGRISAQKRLVQGE